MGGGIMFDVVEAALEDRRREAAVQRRAAAARRASGRRGSVPGWRLHVGRALVAAGGVVGGPDAMARMAVGRAGGWR